MFGDIYTKLRGYYLIWFGNQNAIQRGILEFKGTAVTSVTDDVQNQRTVVQLDASSTNVLAALSGQTPTLGGLNIAAGATVVDQTIVATGATTDGSTITLATVPIPANGIVTLIVEATGKIVGASPVFYPYVILGRRSYQRKGTAAPTVLTDDYPTTSGFLVVNPLPPWTSTGVTLNVSGNNVLVQAQGISAVTAWAATTTYGQWQIVTHAGNTYIARTGGTSGSTGPTGTTNGQADGGGGLVWDWLAAGASVPVSWTLTKLEVLTG
jgi:hypothetical protein